MKYKRLVVSLTLFFLCCALPVRSDNRLRDTLSSSATKGSVRHWEITGPWGGDVRALVVAPDNADLFYLGTSDGQIYRSVDGARSWQRLKPGLGLRGLSVDNLVIDSTNTKVIYAGVWAVGQDEKEQGVYKSDDGGESWSLLKDTKGQIVLSVALAPTDSNFVIAGCKAGVFRSTNAGKSFDRISPEENKEMRGINSVAIDPTTTDIMIVGTHHLPWKTTDGGQTWKGISHKDGLIDDSDIMGVCISSADRKVAHINACSGIYRSNTAGDKWSKLPGIPFTARRTYALTVHPTQPNTVFAGTSEGLWRAYDGGKKWRLLTSKTLVLRAIVIHPAKPERVVIASDDFGVQVSDDNGDSFTEANAGFIHRHILALLPDTHERGRILASVYHDGTAGSVYLSTDGGESWRTSAKGLGARDVFALYQSAEDANVIYAGTNTGVFRSSDRGVSWAFAGKVEVPVEKKPTKKKPTPRRRAALDRRDAEVVSVAANLTKVGNFVAVPAQSSKSKTKKKPTAVQSKKKAAPKKKAVPVVEEPLGPPYVNITKQVNDLTGFTTPEGRRGLMAATMDGLYVTTDEALGWLKVFIADYRSDAPVYSLSTHPSEPRKVYAGTKQGLYVSDDGGANWLAVGRGLEDVTVKAIAQDPRDANLILLGTNQFIYRTTNGGRTWVRRGGGLKAGDFTSVVLNPLNPDEVMACEYSRGGVYRSTDSGYSWERMDEQIITQLPTTRVWTVSFDPFDRDKAYAGSFSSGVYVLKVEREAASSSNR